tara:strand:- start:1517 stop:1759 length:243 start_codon:yes stop_codon:yes gene_type:complete
MSYEGDKYEYKFLVFSILNGPKNMIDNLNAEGDEGWTAYDNLSISDDRIVTFLMRKKLVKVIEPKEERERALSSLWGGNE